jgi:phytoene desaturase
VKIIVIGAGLGGLAAAIRLAAQGHDVTILEKREMAGGRASFFEQDGFVFDRGPTIITAPHFIDELFTLCGRARADQLALVPLDPFYRVRFEDGTVFRWTGREDDTLRQVEQLQASDVDGFRRFATQARQIFERAMPLLDRPCGSLGDMLGFAPALVRARAWRSVADMAERCVRDPRLRQLLSFHSLLIGGHPFRSPTIYALITELEKRHGVWYAMGGTSAVVRALAALLEDVGGEIAYECEVAEILADEATRQVRGVRLANGERLPADVVVSNADVACTYLRLVPARFRRVNTDRRLTRLRYGASVFVLYFGTDRRYFELGHHEILIGPRFREELDDIFHHHRLPSQFSLYVHHPTATDEALAPPGCDSWYALTVVPHLGGEVAWESAGDALRDRIVRYLESRYLPELSKHIVTEARIDPRYFRQEFNSHLGNAFSLEPTLLQSAWFRPHNASEDVQGLYLVGAGTHPGAGIPGVLGSAKIVAKLIGDEPEARVQRRLEPRKVVLSRASL